MSRCLKALFVKQRFEYIFFDSSTSIGIASESLRLWLIYAKYHNTKITPIRARMPFEKVFFGSKYPTKIYDVVSPDIRQESPMVKIILEYYLGVLKIVSILGQRFLGVNDISNFSNFINSNEIYTMNFDGVGIGSLKKLKKACSEQLDVDVSKAIASKCRSATQDLNICMGEYVCLHIRTFLFYGDDANHRNATPENYIPAINFLISMGIKVVRLGDTGNVMSGYKNENFIDYPNSHLKSEEMDLFLIKNCKFYIGTLSGILDTAYLFGKNVLCVNSLDFDMRSNRYGDLVLYKHIYSKTCNKLLSLAESVKQQGEILSFGQKSYEYIENDSLEILDALVVFIDMPEKSRRLNKLPKLSCRARKDRYGLAKEIGKNYEFYFLFLRNAKTTILGSI